MKDRTGHRYGRLTAIKVDHKDKNNRWHWLCKCDCGNYAVAAGDSLTKGLTRSCGCLAKEVLKSGDVRREHGMCGTRIYRIWKQMKTRCLNKNTPDYKKWYGGRGVTVCDEWRNDFKTFYDWAISNGYREDLTIDRIDSNGNYCPENCRWVDLKTQARNTRQNHLITYNGETHCLVEWAEILGVNVQVLRSRVYSGWDDERIITQKVRKSPRRD